METGVSRSVTEFCVNVTSFEKNSSPLRAAALFFITVQWLISNLSYKTIF